ncbi:MAG: hypothetical protein QOE38_1645 [Thermoleophilaceae bacterium]|jgi:hypothetical protein|nr:hypothetical protein [Thermoleophilaceae bacterium]
MAGEIATEPTASHHKGRDIAVSAGILVGFVLVVALVVAGLAEFGCIGNDTVPWPPQGSSRKAFCDNVPYGLGIPLAPLVTLIWGVAAVRRRAWQLLLVGLVLGLAVAVTPNVLIRRTSIDCPQGTHAANFECVP